MYTASQIKRAWANNIDLDTFIQRLNNTPKETYDDRVLVYLEYEFHRGGSWSDDSFTISNKLLEWLDNHNPVLYIGEVNGKHSEVCLNWDDVYANDSNLKIDCSSVVQDDDFISKFYLESQTMNKNI